MPNNQQVKTKRDLFARTLNVVLTVDPSILEDPKILGDPRIHHYSDGTLDGWSIVERLWNAEQKGKSIIITIDRKCRKYVKIDDFEWEQDIYEDEHNTIT